MSDTKALRRGRTDINDIPKTCPAYRARFMKFVQKTDTCWNWTGGTTKPERKGYGLFCAFKRPLKGGGMASAHRVSYCLRVIGSP